MASGLRHVACGQFVRWFGQRFQYANLCGREAGNVPLGAGNGAGRREVSSSPGDHLENDDLLSTNAGVTEGEDIGGHASIVAAIRAARFVRWLLVQTLAAVTLKPLSFSSVPSR